MICFRRCFNIARFFRTDSIWKFNIEHASASSLDDGGGDFWRIFPLEYENSNRRLSTRAYHYFSSASTVRSTFLKKCFMCVCLSLYKTQARKEDVCHLKLQRRPREWTCDTRLPMYARIRLSISVHPTRKRKQYDRPCNRPFSANLKCCRRKQKRGGYTAAEAAMSTTTGHIRRRNSPYCILRATNLKVTLVF